MKITFKPIIVVISAFLSLCFPSTSVKAASDFNFNLYGGSTNFWSNTIFQIPASYLSSLTSLLISDEPFYGGSYRYEIFRLKEAGEKVPIYSGKFFGFKAKDLFSNIQYGLKVGWSPKFSPFGVYVSCAYQFRRFEADFSQVGPTTYKFNSVRPGIGIRVTPFISWLEDEKWCPILEVGTSYNYNFKVKGAYDNAKDQFNSGMISTFGIGIRNQKVAISGGVEIDHYNVFNTDFTPDQGITFPYADVKSTHLNIFISVATEF
ncbi:MAG: hypothetical protein K2M69_06425 [Muribaculaceae bacterium]|nr:hypothetical protein [Muribaculaceae bacterium]